MARTELVQWRCERVDLCELWPLIAVSTNWGGGFSSFFEEMCFTCLSNENFACRSVLHEVQYTCANQPANSVHLLSLL